MKTPIDEMYDFINEFGHIEMKVVNALCQKAHELKAKEKQVIIDSFDNGQANWDEKCQDFKHGKQYYNETFKK